VLGPMLRAGVFACAVNEDPANITGPAASAPFKNERRLATPSSFAISCFGIIAFPFPRDLCE
jgi:hypothetical protein